MNKSTHSRFSNKQPGCEDAQVATSSAAPAIARVNPADLAAEAGVCFLPLRNACIPPKLRWSKKTPFPQRRTSVPGTHVAALEGLQTSSTQHVYEDTGQSRPKTPDMSKRGAAVQSAFLKENLTIFKFRI